MLLELTTNRFRWISTMDMFVKKALLPVYFVLCLVLLNYFYRETFYILSWGDKHIYLWISIFLAALGFSCILAIKDVEVFNVVVKQIFYITIFIFVFKFIYTSFFYLFFGGKFEAYQIFFPLLCMGVSFLVFVFYYGKEDLKNYLYGVLPVSLLVSFYSIDYVKLVSV